MEIKKLESEKGTYLVQVTVTKEELSKEIDSELNSIQQKAKEDGFRAGKVPMNIITKKYGEQTRFNIVKNKVSSVIDQVVREENLDILLQPELDDVVNEEGKNLEFKIKYTLAPEIPTIDLSKITLEKPEVKVGKKQIDERLSKMAEYSKTFEKESSTKSKMGDKVTINAIGYVDDKAFEGGKLENHGLILGSKVFIDNFEEQLVGCKKGDKVTVNVKFPDEYPSKELEGKPARFDVEVVSVHIPSEVKIDDEFAKSMKFEDLKELKSRVEQDIKGEYGEPARVVMKMNLFDHIEDQLKFDPPKALLDDELKMLESNQDQFFANDENAKSLTDKQKQDHINKLAKRRILTGLYLADYCKKNNVTLAEDDIKQLIYKQAMKHPQQAREILEFYQNNEKAVESLKGTALEEKAIDDILEKHVKVEVKEYSLDAFEKLMEKQVQQIYQA